MSETEKPESDGVAISAACVRITALSATKKNNGGLTNEDLNTELSDIPVATRLQAINKLLQSGTIELLQKGKSLIYRIKETGKGSAPGNIDNEEKVIYQIIEEGSNKGIWIRDIRTKSNLIMTQLNKILKNLENKKLIKAVKSVNASKKKVYMLYNLEPDRSVSGGAWYQDQDFEAEFVDVLNQQCLRFLQMRREQAIKLDEGPLAAHVMSCCSVSQVHKFISELGISKIALDAEDLETILKTVFYDGKAERILQSDGTYLYKAVNHAIEPTGLVQMPCGICPVIKSCSDCGWITAKSCNYMSEWLEI